MEAYSDRSVMSTKNKLLQNSEAGKASCIAHFCTGYTNAFIYSIYENVMGYEHAAVNVNVE